MNRRNLGAEAARWVLLCKDDACWEAQQRQEFLEWLRRSKSHVAAFLAAAQFSAHIDRQQLPERTHAPLCKVIDMFDRSRRGTSQSPPPESPSEPSPQRFSRRALLAAAGGGVVCVLGGAVALRSAIGIRSEDVIDSGHVLRIRLGDGVMHAARYSTFRIGDHPPVQRVYLTRGQAAFDLQHGAGRSTLVTTPLCEILVTAARLSVSVADSLVVVTVAHGMTRVIAAVQANWPALTLAAGQKLTVRPGVAHPERIVVDEVERELAWTRGRGELFFNGETIGEAASTFNRFNEVQIHVSPEIAGLSVYKNQGELTKPQHFVNRFVDAWKHSGVRSRNDESGKFIHIFRDPATPRTK